MEAAIADPTMDQSQAATDDQVMDEPQLAIVLSAMDQSQAATHDQAMDQPQAHTLFQL